MVATQSLTRGKADRRDRGKALALATAWLILVVFATPILMKPWPDVLLRTDFVSFWTAGHMVREGFGQSLYDLSLQRRVQDALRSELATVERNPLPSGQVSYYNPPPLALLFVPLSLLPLPTAYLVWTALSFLAFLAAVALPLRGRPSAWTPTVLMLTFGGVVDSLIWGQVNGLFLLAASLGLVALGSGRPALGGALLGFLWLKPQYAVLFPLVFLLKRRWLELAGMAVVGLAVAAASLAMVGADGIAGYLELLNRIGGFRPPPLASVNAHLMVNWRSLLLNVWPAVPEALGFALMLALAAATVLASLLAWRGRWDPTSPRFPRQMLVLMLATVLASPHSHYYGMVLLLGPLSVAIARPWQGTRLEGAWVPMLAVGYLLALALWPYRTLYWLMAPYLLSALTLLVLHCHGMESSR